MAKRENSPTLYQYVKDYIMRLIISGKYPANSQLPTEHELMETLDVGRATVRSALSQLESEGTIYKRQGIGTFVCERSRHYGLEPFLSMSFTMRNLGVTNNNDILKQERIKIPEGFLTERWKKGSEVYHISRLRKAETTPVAIEDNYYTPFAFSHLDSNELENSLCHTLLSNLELNIKEFDSKVIIRDATKREIDYFKIPKNEKVLELTRWLYLEEFPEPINYVRFRVPTHVLEFPFLG